MKKTFIIISIFAISLCLSQSRILSLQNNTVFKFSKLLNLIDLIKANENIHIQWVKFINDDKELIIADGCCGIIRYSLLNNSFYKIREGKKGCSGGVGLDSGPLNSFAISKDNKYLVYGSCDGEDILRLEVFVYDLESKKMLFKFPTNIKSESWNFNASDVWVFSISSKGNIFTISWIPEMSEENIIKCKNKVCCQIIKWNLFTKEKNLYLIVPSKEVLSCLTDVLVMDNDKAIIKDVDNLKVLNLSKNKEIVKIREDKGFGDFLFSDHYLIYVYPSPLSSLKSINGKIKIFDLINKKIEYQINNIYNPRLIQTSDDNILVFIESKDKNVQDIPFHITFQKTLYFFDLIKRRYIKRVPIDPKCEVKAVLNNKKILFLYCYWGHDEYFIAYL